MLHSSDVYGKGGSVFTQGKRVRKEVAKNDSNYLSLKKYVGQLGKAEFEMNKQASKEIPATFGDLIEPYTIGLQISSSTPNKVGDSSLTGSSSMDIKMVDLDTFSFFGTVGNSTLLNGPISQGFDINQRIANRIIMKGLDLMLEVTRNAAATLGAPDTCRIIIAYDKFSESTPPHISSYLINNAGTSDPRDCMDPNARTRWITLYDKFFQVSSSSSKSKKTLLIPSFLIA